MGAPGRHHRSAIGAFGEGAVRRALAAPSVRRGLAGVANHLGGASVRQRHDHAAAKADGQRVALNCCIKLIVVAQAKCNQFAPAQIRANVAMVSVLAGICLACVGCDFK